MSNSLQLRGVGRHALTLVTITPVIVVVLVVLFLWLRLAPPASIARNLPWAFLLTASIGAAVMAFSAAAGRLVYGRPAFVQWAVYLPAFAAAGAVGTLLAPAALYLAGLIPGGRVMVIFEDHIRGTVPATIAFGTFFMTVEIWKARGHAAEMALRAHQLERERAERLASEAQLAALSVRVQPHFLFNTLNSIAALVRENPRQAEQLVMQLSAVIRGSLDSATTVPIDREMKLVTDYLEIQRARLGERLRFDVTWDAGALEGTMVPPFAIQSLVENAVKHVGGRRQQGVTVRVRAHRSADAVLIEVSDNGEGFDPTAMIPGHGLDNLRGRLHALYGPAAGIELQRGEGTMAVRVRVPVR
jgi:signal transduction histidine kinase